MPLKLISASDPLEWFPIYFNAENQRPWPVNDDNLPLNGMTPIELDASDMPVTPNPAGGERNELPIEVAFFGLRKLSSGEMTAIQNRVYKTSRKGRSTFQIGTAGLEKILAACKRVRNVESEGETVFSRKTLESLPPWVHDKLLLEINKQNSLEEDEEED